MVDKLDTQQIEAEKSGATMSSLQLAQLFIKANQLMKEEKYPQARLLLEDILVYGNESQKDIAKNVMLKLDDVPSPVDALAATSIVPDKFSLNDLTLLNPEQSKELGSERRQGIRVGPLNFMIGYADGTELTDLPTFYHVPNSPSWLLGTVNLHGVVLPVFDLVNYFGFKHSKTAKPMLLVLTKDGESVGVVIDGLPQRLRFDPKAEQAEQALASDSVRPHVKTSVIIDEVLWFDLDIPSLLNALEQAL